MVDKKIVSVKAIELVPVAIEDQSILRRRQAREAIFQLSAKASHDQTDEVRRVLEFSLTHTDVQTRRRAAELLGNFGFADLFESAIRDPGWTVREAACSALTRAMNPHASESNIVLASTVSVEDSNRLVRAAAVGALKLVPKTALLPAYEVFEQAMDSRRFTHRKRGLQNLAELNVDVRASHRRMAELLDDSHVRVRIEASRCIERLASSNFDFRFALAAVAKRMFELDGMAGREAAKALETIGTRQPEWNWLRRLIPDQSFFDNLPDLKKTWVYVDRVLGRLLNEAEIEAAFTNVCRNRLKWAEQTLKGTKLKIVQAIAFRQAIQFDVPELRKFAIKETNWMISALIAAHLHKTEKSTQKAS